MHKISFSEGYVNSVRDSHCAIDSIKSVSRFQSGDFFYESLSCAENEFLICGLKFMLNGTFDLRLIPEFE